MSLRSDELRKIIERTDAHMDPELCWILCETARAWFSDPKLNEWTAQSKYLPERLISHLAPIVASAISERDCQGRPACDPSELRSIAKDAFRFWQRAKSQARDSLPETVAEIAGAYIASRLCEINPHPSLPTACAAAKESAVLACSLKSPCGTTELAPSIASPQASPKNRL